MNIQTERLEDQTARVTVEVDTERLDAAKHKAALQISRKVNIPGFRKGKVPYRVLVNYVGEPAILEDALELLSQDIYREMLPETDLDPYGPGVLTDVKSDEPTPTFTYLVPLQPTIDLGDYRSVRLPYEPEPIDDDMVNRAMKNLQEQEAVVEVSQEPAVLSNRLTMDVHSFILDAHEDAEAETEDEAESEAPAEDEAPAETSAEAETDVADEAADEQDEHEEHDHHHDDDEGTPYIHEHDLRLILDDDDEPTPGFNEALVGATVGEAREFTLDVPDDAEKYPQAAGNQVKYYVTVKQIESLTLPELTDEFAARVTKDEDEPLTLLQLRVRVRENLEQRNSDDYQSDYVRRALDDIVEQADIKYPEAMVADQVDRFLQDLDQRLRQQGITLQDYMKIYQKTNDDLYNDYRDNAAKTVERSLVLRTLADVEHIDVTGEDIDNQIDLIVGQFEEERQDMIRQMFLSQATMRESVLNDLLRDRVLERISEIAKGEAPDLDAVETEAAAETEVEVATEAEAEAEAVAEAAADAPAEPSEQTPVTGEVTNENTEESA